MALPPSHDFRLLKRLVTIPRVLEARGAMSNLRRRGSRLVGPCPVHGGDNPTAFVVNLERNLWFCFTGCGGGGDVVDLVRRLDGVGYREAAHRLATLAGGDDPPSSVVPYSPISASRRRPFNPYTRTLRLDPAVPFLQDKGIRLETASRHEVGAWRGRGFLEGCVGVRLHDPEGRPLGYAGRRLDPADAARNGKWKLPSGLPKARMLYNAHRALPRASRGIVVVEGAWGVLRLAQLSLPAVALLGTQLSGHQQALLGGVQRIVLHRPPSKIPGAHLTGSRSAPLRIQVHLFAGRQTGAAVQRIQCLVGSAQPMCGSRPGRGCGDVAVPWCVAREASA